MRNSLATTPDVACKRCTIRLEPLCYRRAWWFRAFRLDLRGDEPKGLDEGSGRAS